MLQRPGRFILLLATLVAASGATCVPRVATQDPLAPAVFSETPSLDELIYNVNTTTNRVQTLHSDSASLSTPGIPASLRATISLERPRRFRLRARLIRPEVDLGSNDEIVWFWASSDPQRAVYLARHERLAAATGPAAFPIDAEWLIQAFGLVELSPYDQHEGPYPRSDGKLEIHSNLQKPTGPLTQSLVIDPKYGWIVEQTVWNAAGQVLAQIRSSDHEYHEDVDVALPHRIDIDLPPAQVTFQIEVANYWINRLLAHPQELWQMPQFEGVQVIDLAGPGAATRRPLAPTALGSVVNYADENRTAYRPHYRGYSVAR